MKNVLWILKNILDFRSVFLLIYSETGQFPDQNHPNNLWSQINAKSWQISMICHKKNIWKNDEFMNIEKVSIKLIYLVFFGGGFYAVYLLLCGVFFIRLEVLLFIWRGLWGVPLFKLCRCVCVYQVKCILKSFWLTGGAWNNNKNTHTHNHE